MPYQNLNDIARLEELIKQVTNFKNETHSPFRRCNKGQHNLKGMVRRKSRLYKHQTSEWGSFKTFQWKCKKAFKQAELNHINEVNQQGFNENNSKSFWRYIKSRRKNSVCVSPLKKMGQLVNDCKAKVQLVVEQYQSVFTRDDDRNLPDRKKTAK